MSLRSMFFLMIVGFALQSCSPKVKTSLSSAEYESISTENEVFVIELGGDVPENSAYVGEIKVGDSGFSTDCGYEKVMQEAEVVARESGANILVVTKVKEPNFMSTCYRVTAKLYRNFEDVHLDEIRRKREFLNRSTLPDDADYAMVHFYRPSNFSGAAVGYKIRHDDDTVIGRVRNGERFSVRVEGFREHRFWARTESNAEVILNVEKGQEYFIRCGIKMGVAVGRPEIYLIDNHIGRKEWKAMDE